MPLDRPLPGFGHIRRFQHSGASRVYARILPGEYYVTNSSTESITTTLGSCISVCIRDPLAGLGGMNHFMLPGDSTRPDADDLRPNNANCYGVFAMESLINSLLKCGGKRSRFEVKVTGGGRIGSGAASIGNSNVNFIRWFLKSEGFQPQAEDLGGLQPRKVDFDPLSGTLRIKKLPPVDAGGVAACEARYSQQLRSEPYTGTVELFE